MSVHDPAPAPAPVPVPVCVRVRVRVALTPVFALTFLLDTRGCI